MNESEIYLKGTAISGASQQSHDHVILKIGPALIHRYMNMMMYQRYVRDQPQITGRQPSFKSDPTIFKKFFISYFCYENCNL